MQLTLNEAEGQRLQREGQEKVMNINEMFMEVIRNYAIKHSRDYGMVTTDDLRTFAVGIGLYPTHHNIWGCIFKQKGWTVIGYQPTKLPNGHARKICVWKWEGV